MFIYILGRLHRSDQNFLQYKIFRVFSYVYVNNFFFFATKNLIQTAKKY